MSVLKSIFSRDQGRHGRVEKNEKNKKNKFYFFTCDSATASRSAPAALKAAHFSLSDERSSVTISFLVFFYREKGVRFGRMQGSAVSALAPRVFELATRSRRRCLARGAGYLAVWFFCGNSQNRPRQGRSCREVRGATLEKCGNFFRSRKN